MEQNGQVHGDTTRDFVDWPDPNQGFLLETHRCDTSAAQQWQLCSPNDTRAPALLSGCFSISGWRLRLVVYRLNFCMAHWKKKITDKNGVEENHQKDSKRWLLTADLEMGTIRAPTVSPVSIAHRHPTKIVLYNCSHDSSPAHVKKKFSLVRFRKKQYSQSLSGGMPCLLCPKMGGWSNKLDLSWEQSSPWRMWNEHVQEQCSLQPSVIIG